MAEPALEVHEQRLHGDAGPALTAIILDKIAHLPPLQQRAVIREFNKEAESA
jgi:hypothetical protein